ncbi:uncharacterized protein KY384_006547 [Bacidia gigantensis]|uniref:uncharacterized protein n=1 Tax=Bacidia gigantensis TaxID=2732470 RepID=UPI001D043E38|nr:uncharacterized protein KY384_006547 [Bacidia gigantensis]KAG8528858.1 hypothetical protein KY384_006547 [Bacidia gigantensis]
MAYVARADESEKPLTIENQCAETIYPGIVTQSGQEPEIGGFKLDSGDSRSLTVGADWQGRVWGRTNCSFNAQGTGPGNNGGNNGGGRACGTGDCGGIVNCRATGETPVSLAEFTLASPSGQTFYDISLVDGYNIPIAIVSLYPQSGNSSLQQIPPNLTNPICIGTSSLLGAKGSTEGSHSGTNDSFPIPLEESVSTSDVASWCPWDLQLSAPTKPGDGIYPYPDDKIQRPIFDPCFSACAKYNKPSDCCTGHYDNPNVCKASIYSKNAKKVCPDAYSFAFDDQTSTFIIPSGGGFQVTFCPQGRSSNIISVYKKQLLQLTETGHVSSSSLSDLEGVSVVRTNGAAKRGFLDEMTFLICTVGTMAALGFLIW